MLNKPFRSHFVSSRISPLRVTNSRCGNVVHLYTAWNGNVAIPLPLPLPLPHVREQQGREQGQRRDKGGRGSEGKGGTSGKGGTGSKGKGGKGGKFGIGSLLDLVRDIRLSLGDLEDHILEML